MTKQYIITEAERDTWLTIMRNNPQDPDAYYAITELQSLPELTTEPAAWMNTDDLCADTAFRWCKLDEFTSPVYTSPQPLQPITAEDVTDEMWSTFSEIAAQSPPDIMGEDKQWIAAAYNAVLNHRGDTK